jgi:cytochrome c oxidase assembly protein subunit 15
MTDRVFALLTAAYLAWLVRKLKTEPELRVTLLALSAFSISQIVVGVTSIWLDVPLLLLSLHNVLAACLLMAAINFVHRLTPATRSALPG